MGGLRRLVFACVAILLAAAASAPGTRAAQITPDNADAVNASSIGIITGGVSGTYIRIANDLASVLDGDEMRILPVAGKGSVQNVSDLLYIKGVDVAVVQSDVLAYLRDQRTHGDIENRLHYVTKLYNEEFHVLARKDLADISALDGKRVNYGNPGSGTHMTATVVFGALGLKPEPTNYDEQTALAKLKSGEIDAMVFVAGKPASIFRDLTAEDGLKLVPVAYGDALQKTYLPSSFSAEDYPGLVPAGENVDTIAVGAVMAVFNWKEGSERSARLKRFIEAFFDNFAALQQAPRHAKWQEVNLGAEMPGWTRYPVAEKWLERRNAELAQKTDTQGRDVTALRQAFKEFLASSGEAQALSANDQEELFRRFLKWQGASQ